MIRLSTEDLPDPNQLDSLFEVYGRTIIKHGVEPGDDRPFRFEANLYSLPSLGLALTIISPCRAPRRVEHIDGDDLVLSILLSGARTVNQLNREVMIRDGQAILTTCGSPGVVSIHATSRMIGLRVPRAIIEGSVADIDAALLRPIPRDTPALRLLTSYIGAIENALAGSTPDLCAIMVKHCHDLFAMALGPTRDAAELARGRGVRAARLHSIERQIVANLHNKTLSIGAVAAAHGISPRYVNLLFEEIGKNFTQYVLEKRLELAAGLCATLDGRIGKFPRLLWLAGLAICPISTASSVAIMARRPRTCARALFGKFATD